jgi:hypothetical protein
MRVSAGLRGDPCVTSYVVCALAAGWSEQFTLMLFDSVEFLGTCATATTFTCAAIFQCLSILTIDFPPNCFDYCDVMDNQLAIMSKTSIYISIKKNGRWTGFLVL